MRRRATPRLWLTLIVATVLIFGVSFGVLQARCARDGRALTEQRLYRDQLKLRVSDLSDQLNYAQSDEYIIRVARDELGMIMPNEVRYVNGAR